MRNISFALTTPQFIDGSKDVTRRLGWLDLMEGDQLCAVEKSQGLCKGEKVKRLGVILIVSVRREWLRRISDNPAYGLVEVRREGFPKMSPEKFVAFFIKSHKGCNLESIVTRIEYKKVPT